MNWAKAFALQACSDFEATDWLLENSSLPQCHQLHSLQMAMEKTAEAHYMARGDNAEAIQSSHAYVAKAIPIIVRDGLGRTGAKPGWLMSAIQTLARRIELLAPSVDALGTIPSNCEYPWKDSAGRIAVPAHHDFLLGLHEKAAITMIKEVRARARELSGA